VNQGGDLPATAKNVLRHRAKIACERTVDIDGRVYELRHLMVHDPVNPNKKTTGRKITQFSSGHFTGYVAVGDRWIEHNDNSQQEVDWKFVNERAQRLAGGVLVLTNETQKRPSPIMKVLFPANLMQEIMSFLEVGLPWWDSFTTLSKSLAWFRPFRIWNLTITISDADEIRIAERLELYIKHSVPVTALRMTKCAINPKSLTHIWGLRPSEVQLNECSLVDLDQAKLREGLDKVPNMVWKPVVTSAAVEVGADVGWCCLNLFVSLSYMFLCLSIHSARNKDISLRVSVLRTKLIASQRSCTTL
jgi:hypothetical protein